MKESEEAQDAGRYIKAIRDPDKRLYAQRYFFYLLGYDLKTPSSRPLKEEEARELQVALEHYFETPQYSTTAQPTPEEYVRQWLAYYKKESKALGFPLSEKQEKYLREEYKRKLESGESLKLPYSTQTKSRFLMITDPGQSTFSEGITVSEAAFDKENARLAKASLRPAKGIFLKGSERDEGGNGKKPSEELEKLEPATIEAETIPDKYRWLIPFIGDEPLPPEANILLPAVETLEGERKIDAVLRRLAEGVEGLQDSAQFRLYLTTMSKFHKYSISNMMLIMLQKPNATHVAGFVTWKDLGRGVKKGESGIAILAPSFLPKAPCPKCGARISKGAEFCPKCGEPVEMGEIEINPRYFPIVHVFDISQTEGKPLPEFEVPVLTGEANEDLFANVLELAKSQGLDVSFESRPSQDPSIKGQYSAPRSIWVRPEESSAQQLKSLLHEVAHYYSGGVFQIPRRDAETIAESGAFAVGAHYGFDSGVRSFPYVALWAQDKKVLQQNLEAIRKVTDTMLHALEGASKQLVQASVEPTPRPKRDGDLEYIADSPEYLTYTIDNSGQREALDKAFAEAMARCRK